MCSFSCFFSLILSASGVGNLPEPIRLNVRFFGLNTVVGANFPDLLMWSSLECRIELSDFILEGVRLDLDLFDSCSLLSPISGESMPSTTCNLASDSFDRGICVAVFFFKVLPCPIWILGCLLNVDDESVELDGLMRAALQFLPPKTYN